MDGLRRLIVERLLQALALVEGDIPPQTADSLRNAPVIVARDLLVLEGPPQALDEDVVQRPPPPIHTDPEPTDLEPLTVHPAQQVGIDLRPSPKPTQVWLGIDRFQAHEPQPPLDAFVINLIALGPQPRRHPPDTVVRRSA